MATNTPMGTPGAPVSARPSAQPVLGQRGREIQQYGTLTRYPLGLSDEVRLAACEGLNQVLADSITLRDMYKKHHWQVSGPTFYSLHRLYEKHAEAQTKLIDLVAERIQTLGGVALAMAADIAETTSIERPPRGREEVPVQISRLLDAHERILVESRELAHRIADMGDDGTNDILVSEVIRTNELQVWFLSELLVDTPLVVASRGS
ncbi:MAG: DNA starvation/stationary phase protection protein [Pseudomonadota bacterium]